MSSSSSTMELEGAPAALPLPAMDFLLLLSMVACAIVGIIWWGRWAFGKSARLPPAPPGWRPVLGHVHLLGQLPHQALWDLAKQHGRDFVSLRLGSMLAIVASTPESAQLVLQAHDQAFLSRPRTAAGRYIGFNWSDIAFSPAGPYWRHMRQICTTDLFSNKCLSTFRPIRVEEVHALLRAALEERGQLMQVRPKLLSTTYNIISRMTIGQRLSEIAFASAKSGSRSPDVVDLLSDMMHLIGKFNLGDFIPFLGFMDLQGYEKRMKLAGQLWSSILQDLLELRRAAMKTRIEQEEGGAPATGKDLLSVLLSMSDMSDNNIKAVVSDMFLGGVDTTAITAEWVIAELLANPSKMGALREEIDRVVGRARLVQEEDIVNLPYLQAVVKESMRLHPPGPLMSPHEATEACRVREYLIPPKTRVIVNVWAIGRDPNVWENPLLFEPERFLPEGKYNHVSVNGQQFQLLPFGFGRRGCPAVTLGLVSVQIMVASLVQSFDWALPPKGQVDLSERFGLTVNMASPLAIIPTPRVDPSLYKESL